MSPPATARASTPPALPSPEFAKSLGGEMETDARALVQRVGPIAIRNQSELAQAALDRQELGDRLKRIDDFFKPFTDMAHKLHKALVARRDEIKAPLETIDTKLKNAIILFKADDDRRRREEEARLAETQRKADEARAATEAAALEAAGEPELAAAVLEQAIDAPAPVVVLQDTTKVDGMSYRREWKWRWLNGDQARALQLLPREYLMPDEKRIGSVVKAMKDATKIPGVQVYYEDVPVRR